MKEVKNVIVVGASAGGFSAVSRLVKTFNEDLNAAVFIVIHTSRSSMSEVILNLIQKHTSLSCTIPNDGSPIENNKIYLAETDHHMMLEDGKILIKKGAYENQWRPSIDVLFRSAAAAYGSCVTGIILTGLLDDGSSGMSAIKRSGGKCIVQDPSEAEFPDMPNNVLSTVSVDYKLPISEMGYVLFDIYTRDNCGTQDIPEDVRLEAKITRQMSSEVEEWQKLSNTLVPLTCPDCGGSLVEIKEGNLKRYRCYTGHSFSQKSLDDNQVKGLEQSLWVAIRMMEERKNLLHSMMADNGAFDDRNYSMRERAETIRMHIERLKAMLMELGEEPGKSERKAV